MGGATEARARGGSRYDISIHAPRGGSDSGYWYWFCVDFKDFNPRSPWGERLVRLFPCLAENVFQSTLPVGGATEETRQKFDNSFISIHAPRGGSDVSDIIRRTSTGNFNPRSPWGERRLRLIWIFSQSYFNPRSPWGERLTSITRFLPELVFQSTLPVGGATGASDSPGQKQ